MFIVVSLLSVTTLASTALNLITNSQTTMTIVKFVKEPNAFAIRAYLFNYYKFCNQLLYKFKTKSV